MQTVLLERAHTGESTAPKLDMSTLDREIMHVQDDIRTNNAYDTE